MVCLNNTTSVRGNRGAMNNPTGMSAQEETGGPVGCWYCKPNCLLSEVKSRQGERVGVHQQNAYFIHRVAINFLFSVAWLQHRCDLCVRAIIWVGLLGKCFDLRRLRDDWCSRACRAGTVQSLSRLGPGSNSITKNTHGHGVAHHRIELRDIVQEKKSYLEFNITSFFTCLVGQVC